MKVLEILHFEQCFPLNSIDSIPTQQLYFKRQDNADSRYANAVTESELRQRFTEAIPRKTRDQ